MQETCEVSVVPQVSRCYSICRLCQGFSSTFLKGTASTCLVSECLSDSFYLAKTKDCRIKKAVEGEERLLFCLLQHVKKKKRFRCVKCRRKLSCYLDNHKHKQFYCKRRRISDSNARMQFACLKCNYRSKGRIQLTTCILHSKIVRIYFRSGEGCYAKGSFVLWKFW